MQLVQLRGRATGSSGERARGRLTGRGGAGTGRSHQLPHAPAAGGAGAAVRCITRVHTDRGAAEHSRSGRYKFIAALDSHHAIGVRSRAGGPAECGARPRPCTAANLLTGVSFRRRWEVAAATRVPAARSSAPGSRPLRECRRAHRRRSSAARGRVFSAAPIRP
ncbi:hypothetical protein EVAR_45545_1 [Eumeta japonica]|uniref:Uncharacterized protein n=1 Tax=Eumeta variegata TaxID=151549 RepID=A0A4C1XAP3_EUMVA|nr:hypothetical protein EVAR_45545_1 [Eumeta japonica]